MDKPNTEPLRLHGYIVHDVPQQRLDAAREAHRRAYNRGFSLSERGFDVKAQQILDKANAALAAAEEEYAKARGF